MQKKRKILVVSLIVSLIAILSVGSLAWFSAKDEVTNTFQMANDFKIDVYETDKDGNVVKNPAGDTTGQTYTGIMPGQELHKDPTVKNTGSHKEWVRVSVTLTEYHVWAQLVEDGADISGYFKGFDDKAWKRSDAPVVDSNADTITYTYYLTYKLDSGKEKSLFTAFTIPGELTSEQAADMGNDFAITVTAEAVQVENLNATSAMDAFSKLED